MASGDDIDRYQSILGGYLDRLNDGELLDPDEILAAHPDDGPAILRDLEAFVAASSSQEGAGPKTLGDYKLLRQVGRGGMGVVYEAWQESMKRRVALKVLPAGVAADARTVGRFVREAQLAGSLQHPNVVAVFGMGVEAETPYYAMDFVEGETLAHAIRRRKPGELPSTGECFALAEAFAGAADGLQHAHRKGIVHRDIKPSNLMLDREGRLRILDFGLARLEGGESITRSGDLVGTILYMSPEQARARQVKLDHRTDIYSLGATLYEALCGAPPHRGRDDQDTLTRIAADDPAPPYARNRQIPPDLETVVLKCLRKDPGDRYGTAEALAQDLRRFARNDRIEARRETALERVVRWTARHARLLGVAALICLLASLLAWALLRQAEQARLLEAERGQRNAERYRELVTGAALRIEEALGATGTVVFPGAGFLDLAPADGGGQGAGGGGPTNAALPGAIADLEAAVRLLPERPDALYHQARALTALGEAARAEAVLDRLLEVTPDFAPALALRHPETKAAVAADGESWQSTWLAAQDALARREWEEAAEAFGRLLHRIEGSEEPYIGAEVELRSSRGKAHLAAKAWLRAIVDFAAAAALSRGAPEPHFLLANAQYWKGDRDEADRVLGELWRRSIQAEGIAERAAGMYLALGDPKRAAPWVERLAPGDARDLLQARLWSQEGQHGKTVELCDAILKRSPGQVEALKTKGWAQWRQADNVASRRTAEEALRLAPGDSDLWLLMGWSEHWLCNLPAAEAAFQGGLRTLEGRRSYAALGQADHLNGLGWLRIRTGELEAAKTTFEEAVKNDPRMGPAWQGLGIALHELGNPAEGSRCFAEGLKGSPADRSLFILFLRSFYEDTAAQFRPNWRELAEAARDGIDRGLKIDRLHAIVALADLNDPRGTDPGAALAEAKLAAAQSDGFWIRGILAEALFAASEGAEAVRVLERLDAEGSISRFHAELLDTYRRSLLPQVASIASLEWWLAACRSGTVAVAANAIAESLRADGSRQAQGLGAYLAARLLEEQADFTAAAGAFGRLLDATLLDATDRQWPLLRRARCRIAVGALEQADLELRSALAGGDGLLDARALWRLWLELQWTRRGRGLREILDAWPSQAQEGYAADLRWLVGELAERGAVRIHAGGDDYTDTKGRTWGRDRFFLGGEPQMNYPPEIHGTDDDALYHRGRNFPFATARKGYELPLPPGRYRVTTHYCEKYIDDSRGLRPDPRQRLAVIVEGVPVNGYDPVTHGFCGAHWKAVEVEVRDSLLEIVVVKRTDWYGLAFYPFEVERLDG